MSLYSDDFLAGDRGGNLIKITVPSFSDDLNKRVNEFHKLWDSIMGEWTDVERPMDSSSKARFKKFFDRATKKYPKSFFGDDAINLMDIGKWSTGAYKKFWNKVYAHYISQRNTYDEDTHPLVIKDE